MGPEASCGSEGRLHASGPRESCRRLHQGWGCSRNPARPALAAAMPRYTASDSTWPWQEGWVPASTCCSARAPWPLYWRRRRKRNPEDSQERSKRMRRASTGWSPASAGRMLGCSSRRKAPNPMTRWRQRSVRLLGAASWSSSIQRSGSWPCTPSIPKGAGWLPPWYRSEVAPRSRGVRASPPR